MGYIQWTKSWSASDNGTIFGGSDLQNLQNDITTVVNGGLTNSNIDSGAGIEESKISFDTSAGHDHDGSNSKLIAATNRHYIGGCELEYVDAANIKAKPGTIEINGSVYTRDEYSSSVNLGTASWLHGSEPSDDWVYIYAYNDSGTSWDIKVSDEAPAYSSCDTSYTDGELRYRDYSSVWYRCIGAVCNASDDIVKFYQYGNWIIYDNAWDTLEVQSNGSATTWTDIDCSTYVPAFSRLAIAVFTMENGAVGIKIRANGSTAGNGQYIKLAQNEVGNVDVLLDASQVFEYKVDANQADVDIAGYYLGQIR